MATMRAGVTHWHAGLIEVGHGMICKAYAILMVTHGPSHPITKDLEVPYKSLHSLHEVDLAFNWLLDLTKNICYLKCYQNRMLYMFCQSVIYFKTVMN